MIVSPRVRGFICTTSHYDGCFTGVKESIDYVNKSGALKEGSAKKVLVIGSSMGYGLATRVVTAFGGGASTVGVFFERPGNEKRTATAGWYNTVAFTKLAKEKGLYAKNINGDAFSNEIKQKAIAVIKRDLQQVDLVVYSLASPKRIDPKTGETYSSVLKPIGKTFSDKTIDPHTKVISNVQIEPANEQEIANTVKVMGGEDWMLWIEALMEANVLAPNALTLAYSYIGPKVTQSVYRQGTIGKAKEHLEASAEKITELLKSLNGKAYIAVNKALVTQASSAIPVLPLYIALLFKVMKEKGNHEDCIQQMYRLFTEKIPILNEVQVDNNNYIRLDDWEMAADIQKEVADRWEKIKPNNVDALSDIDGYKNSFLQLFGFNYEKIDYNNVTSTIVDMDELE